MVRFRPSMFPSHIVATAPTKQPRVYAPTYRLLANASHYGLHLLTCDGLNSRRMARRAPWRRVHGIDLREVAKKRWKREQTSHYALI
jgi:hypothetical protein